MHIDGADSNLVLHELRSIYRSARRGLLMGVAWSPQLRRQRARQIALLTLSIDWTTRLTVINAFGRLIDGKFAETIRARVFSLTHRPLAPMRAKGLKLRSGRVLRAA
ncbi:MAG: hypothetical protein ACHREM_08115 [Polyangiales bacterium]